MLSLLDDLESMGVQGIEVSGGGEPLAYPYSGELWSALALRPFATALVTNGTLLTEAMAPAITAKMKWARVSIDAASAATYAQMRLCPERHWRKAWDAVRLLRESAPADPEFKLGVGFVLSNENMGEVQEFVKMAAESGADNCRLTATFSDRNLDYFHDRKALARAIGAATEAEAKFSSKTFHVHNLLHTRAWEIAHPVQDYKRCPIKDFICVVEGEGKVYSCCTLTGSTKGCYGKFHEHPGGFRGLWEEGDLWRRTLVASDYCTNACLYRDRNIAMNELIDGLQEEGPEHVHKEFI